MKEEKEKVIGTIEGKEEQVKSKRDKGKDFLSELRELTLQYMEQEGITFEEFLKRGKERSKVAIYKNFKKMLIEMKKDDRKAFIENLRKIKNVNVDLWEDLRDYEKTLD